MATKRLNLRKIVKNQLLKSYVRDKAETAEMFKALASTKVLFLFLLLLRMHFGCYGKLEFP